MAGRHRAQPRHRAFPGPERRPKAARLAKYDDDPYQGLPPGILGLLEESIRSDDARVVWRGLRAIAGPQREIVLLSFWGGLTRREIEQRTGRPLGTVKRWLQRSMIAMRETLANPIPLDSPSVR